MITTKQYRNSDIETEINRKKKKNNIAYFRNISIWVSVGKPYCFSGTVPVPANDRADRRMAPQEYIQYIQWFFFDFVFCKRPTIVVVIPKTPYGSDEEFNVVVVVSLARACGCYLRVGGRASRRRTDDQTDVNNFSNF